MRDLVLAAELVDPLHLPLTLSARILKTWTWQWYFVLLPNDSLSNTWLENVYLFCSHGPRLWQDTSSPAIPPYRSALGHKQLFLLIPLLFHILFKISDHTLPHVWWNRPLSLGFVEKVLLALPASCMSSRNDVSGTQGQGWSTPWGQHRKPRGRRQNQLECSFCLGFAKRRLGVLLFFARRSDTHIPNTTCEHPFV